jgi:hypothetical protein
MLFLRSVFAGLFSASAPAAKGPSMHVPIAVREQRAAAVHSP